MFTPQPFINGSGKRIASFTFFGGLGLILSLSTTFYLVRFLDLSLRVWLVLALIGLAVFFGLAEIMNRLKGKSELVYYHHELAILLFSSGFLLFTKPSHILSYLDLTVIGLGIVLIFGRIGCFMAGCCHGKPASRGIQYHKAHAEMGFPYYFLNTRLFPVQLLEAVGVSLLVIFMLISIWLQMVPGTALAVYILGYGVLRFFLEFARGDIDRPYYGPFSEAQWFSVLFALLLLLVSYVGGLPGFIWELTIIILVGAGFAFLFLSGDFSNPWIEMRHYQIKRLALFLNELHIENNRDLRLRLGKNTLLVTAGILEEENMTVKHFTVSMYPEAKSNWLDYIGNTIYLLHNSSGHFTKIPKSNTMTHFIIKFPKKSLIAKVV